VVLVLVRVVLVLMVLVVPELLLLVPSAPFSPLLLLLSLRRLLWCRTCLGRVAGSPGHPTKTNIGRSRGRMSA
jgi:hypothetical protein